MTILAGDIGGTNLRLAIYDDEASDKLCSAVFPTQETIDPGIAIREFLDQAEIDGIEFPHASAIGIAGPISDGLCRGTNLPWDIDERDLRVSLGIEQLKIVNDFTAQARTVPALGPRDLLIIQEGEPEEWGPILLLGPGTGLGVGYLLPDPGCAGGFRIQHSEGGHASFAPRSHWELGLMSFLQERYGRVSNERLLSGAGLTAITIYTAREYLHDTDAGPALEAIIHSEGEDAASLISDRAFNRDDAICQRAITTFFDILGAVAGDMALILMATGGIYIGGGMVPKLLPAFDAKRFRSNLGDKGRFIDSLGKIPVSLIRHPDPGLRGAALLARDLHRATTV
ncbi:MAG: glucokinase [Planctomycetota bacterium]|jgi:glucokinase